MDLQHEMKRKIKEKYISFDKKLSAFGQKHKEILKYIALVCVFLLPIFCVKKSLDTDIWFLLNSGRYILEHGFTTVEPFSIYEGLAFSFQQWLTDVYFYIIYQKFGQVGLIITIWLESTILSFVFYRLCKYITNGNTSQSMLATIIFTIVLSAYMVTRPQITSILLLVLEVFLLERYAREQNSKPLLWLLLLSVLEINLHAATWWMMFVFLLPYLCESSRFNKKRITADEYSKCPLILVALGMFLAGFVNPYGLTNVLYLFKSFSSDYIKNVSEMGPPTYASMNFICIVCFTVVLVGYYWNNTEKIKMRYFFFYAGCFLLNSTTTRNYIYMAIWGALICAYAFREKAITGFSVQYVLLYFEILAGALIIAGDFQPVDTISNMEKEHSEIVSFLEKRCEPRETDLYTGYNIGAFYEYAGFRCAMDARMEVFIKSMNGVDDYFDQVLEVDNGLVYYKDFLEKHDFDYYIIEKDRAIYLFLSHDADYEQIYETQDYVVFNKSVGKEQ